MRIVFSCTYGALLPENNFLELLGCRLRGMFPDTRQLVCDGALSFCRRDLSSPDSRECSTCMFEQIKFARWANLNPLELSRLIEREDILNIKKTITPAWIAAGAKWDGIELASLLKESPVALTANPQAVIKTIQSAALLAKAVGRMLTQVNPDQVMTSGKNDFFGQTLIAVLQQRKIKHTVFAQDPANKRISITRSTDGFTKQVDLLISDLLSIRSDFRTWPTEALMIIREVLEFLDIRNSQLTLPLAR